MGNPGYNPGTMLLFNFPFRLRQISYFSAYSFPLPFSRKLPFAPTVGPVNFIVLMQAFRTQRNIVTILHPFHNFKEHR